MGFKQRVARAHEADRVRLAVVQKYGGIYLDATIILLEGFNGFVGNIAPEKLEESALALSNVDSD